MCPKKPSNENVLKLTRFTTEKGRQQHIAVSDTVWNLKVRLFFSNSPECPTCRNDLKLWLPSEGHFETKKQKRSRKSWTFLTSERRQRCGLLQRLTSRLFRDNTSIYHTGAEFVEARTTFQQQGQAIYQNKWDINSTWHSKILHQNLRLENTLSNYA